MELVVGIGILAILSALLIVILNPFEQFKKADDTKRKSDLAQIQRALEAYYQDFGMYPDDNNATSTYKIVVGGEAIEWGSDWSPYIEVLPSDPTSTKKYIYKSDGQSYWLYASLDRGIRDIQICHADGSSCDGVPVGIYCGLSASDVCNYGVSSPNTSP